MRKKIVNTFAALSIFAALGLAACGNKKGPVSSIEEASTSVLTSIESKEETSSVEQSSSENESKEETKTSTVQESSSLEEGPVHDSRVTYYSDESVNVYVAVIDAKGNEYKDRENDDELGPEYYFTAFPYSVGIKMEIYVDCPDDYRDVDEVFVNEKRAETVGDHFEYSIPKAGEYKIKVTTLDVEPSEDDGQP
ncbi:MAG: hypothetical protein MJ238_03870 [Bacilli bacterium]|nr:hypothetical protein [Bacilli bacterium]